MVGSKVWMKVAPRAVQMAVMTVVLLVLMRVESLDTSMVVYWVD